MPCFSSDAVTPVHLFADNQRLSARDLTLAKDICRDAVKMVKDRDLAVD